VKRVYMFLRLIVTIFILTISQAIASTDREISESLKCASKLPYFEKKYNIPKHTLYSIALKESGKLHSTRKFHIVWPWAVNLEGQSHFFNTKREAINFVKQQIIDGKENIDIGCMQINIKHHIDAFLTLEEGFDPTINIDYGAKFLKSKYDQLKNWRKAISHYHSATEKLGTKYQQDVVKIASNMHNYHNNLKAYSIRDYITHTTKSRSRIFSPMMVPVH
jgi:soluble lytic murein transglycosylase-like protein